MISISRWNGQHISFHPAAVLLALLAIGSLLFYGGFRQGFTTEVDGLAKQADILKAGQQQLQIKLARSEAELALRDSQINGLKQQIHQDIRDRQLTQQRLAMFDDVLAARTVRGVHVLHPEAHWLKAEGLIEYKLVLVKGENYPRWALGHLEFSTRMPDGEILNLTDAHGKMNIKYEMTTHLFMEGALLWHGKAPPSSIIVTLVNHLDKKIRQAESPVFSIIPAPDYAQEKQHD